jgi:hypothetical protein
VFTALHTVGNHFSVYSLLILLGHGNRVSL